MSAQPTRNAPTLPWLADMAQVSTADGYTDWALSADLANVYLLEFRAARVGNVPEGSETEVNMEINVATKASDDGDDTESFRFDFRFRITAAEEEIARASAVYVTEFRVASPAPSEEYKMRFVEDIAVMAAYPYAREFLQSSGQRLGLPGLTVGLLKRGAFTMTSALSEAAGATD